MDGLDPAIGYPHQIANDAVPVSNHPTEITGSSPVMTGMDRCVRYVNSKGPWYQAPKIPTLPSQVMDGLDPAIGYP